MNVLNWVAARTLDAGIAVDEMPPAWMVFLGLALFGGAVATLTWLVVAARDRRRQERSQPDPGNLVVAQPWLAEESIETREIRVPARDMRRKPSPIARSGGVYHGQPVHDPDETHQFVAQRPAGYRGGRRA